MGIPSSTLRLALQYARESVLEEPNTSLHGALFSACNRLEHKREDQSALYTAARTLLDQTERLGLLDRALETLKETP